MGEKLQNIGGYVQEYSQYARDGLIELSKHPVKHTSKALKDLIKDYWDAGLAVATGLTLTDYGKDIIDDQYVFTVIGGLVSLSAPLFMNRQENETTKLGRLGRNAMMLFGTPFATSAYADENPLSPYPGVFSFALATLFEYVRRAGKAPSITDSPTHDVLENKLQKTI